MAFWPSVGPAENTAVANASNWASVNEGPCINQSHSVRRGVISEHEPNIHTHSSFSSIAQHGGFKAMAGDAALSKQSRAAK